jgi:hypothetical protein
MLDAGPALKASHNGTPGVKTLGRLHPAVTARHRTKRRLLF